MPISIPILLPADISGNALTVGERRKRLALDYLESRHLVYIRRGRRALLSCLLRYGAATIDDVREEVDLPSGLSSKLFGAVPGALARAGIIASCWYVRSRRPEAHAHLLVEWMLADQSAALRWLRSHPDLPDDDPSQSPGKNGLSPSFQSAGSDYKMPQ